MINEVLEVQQFLEGKNIYKDSHYRICYLMAMWYSEQGFSRYEARQKILAWANQYGIYLSLSVNAVVTNAYSTARKLRDDTVAVWANENDIAEINGHFDRASTKKVALALLSLAKVTADKTGEFDVSVTALAHWVDIDRANLSTRALVELEDFEYIKKIETVPVSTWDKRQQQPRSRPCRYKLLVPCHNSGNILLRDNDITAFYEDAFNPRA
jgi:hypothetical protein